MADETGGAGAVRLDKWLWAARFFKSRGLATEAVNGGRVHVNGARAKPAKDVRPGDVVELTIGDDRRTVVVVATAERRGPASVAATLYEETPESLDARARRAEERRLEPAFGDYRIGGRPTKLDRRRTDSLRGRTPRR